MIKISNPYIIGRRILRVMAFLVTQISRIKTNLLQTILESICTNLLLNCFM